MRYLVCGSALLLGAANTLAACGDPEDDLATAASSSGAGPSVALHGGVEKGPFIVGTTVVATVLNPGGAPTGQVFQTQTLDDAGAFELTIGAPGLVALDAAGFYYNELLGALSGASLTLRAVAELSASGTQQVYINLITHLTRSRIAGLMAGGDSLADATTQAEAELREALGVGPAGFDPQAAGTEITLLQGDDDASAYLLAVGAVLLQVASTEAGPGGPVDATFQELLNTMAADFAESGDLPQSTRDMVHAAEVALDGDLVMANLGERLQAIGSASAVPDVHRVLDPDEDDLPNLVDNCPNVANPDQLDSDLDAIGDACACGNGQVDEGEACDDGNGVDHDGCTTECTPTCEIVADLPFADAEPYFGGFAAVTGGLVFFAGPQGSVDLSPWFVDPTLGSATPIATTATRQLYGGQAALGGFVYFEGKSGGLEELWRTDGTEAGTTSMGVSGGQGPFAFGDAVFFDSSTPATGTELWRTDGSVAGTGLFADTNPGPGSGLPGAMTALGDLLLFQRCAGSQDLWASDGTMAGTALVTTLSMEPTCGPGSPPMSTGLGLAFFLKSSSQPPYEVWRSDGTAPGTYPLVTGLQNQLYGEGVELAGYYYTGGDQTGLIRTDGTAPGTEAVGSFVDALPFAVAGGAVLFRGREPNGPLGLWRTDGTPANTFALLASAEVVGWLGVGDRAYVVLLENGKSKLWTTDGTVAGTFALAPELDLDAATSPALTLVGDHVYLAAEDGVHGVDPWRCKAQ